MAKGSFAKSNNDRFLTYMVVGFAAIIVTLVVGLILYNVFNEELTYESFDHITSFYDIEDQNEDQYLVYFYSEACSYCNTIKSQVLNFADDNEAGVKVYFLDNLVATGKDRIVRDPDTLATMDGTPSIITVVDGQITHMSPGYDQVLDTLEAINNDSYDFN